MGVAVGTEVDLSFVFLSLLMLTQGLTNFLFLRVILLDPSTLILY